MKQILTLGEILIKNGAITEEGLNAALEKQRSSREKLGKVLIQQGFITEEQLFEALGEQGKKRLNISELEDMDSKLMDLFDEKYMRESLVVPYKISDNRFLVITNEPSDYKVTDYILQLVKEKNNSVTKVETYLGTKAELIAYLDNHFNSENQLFVQEDEPEESVDDENADLTSNDNPVVKYVNDVLDKAIREHTSDIHIEGQFNAESVVRFRIHGELVVKSKFPRSWHKKVVSIIKIQSNLNISEKNEPQDGEIRHKYNNGFVNMRVSTLPTVNGEKICIRILGGSANLVDMEMLGFSKENKEIFIRNLDKHRGMVLITAPTGEGKTTTLYSALKYLNQPNVNIQTLEDPVEIRLPGINQAQVTPRMTYAKALKAVLRQDPNVVMMGEIREQETGDIAVKASLTGHMVLSTLHTKDTYSVISRLLNMGIASYLIADSLELVIAQRLIKTLCPKCKEEDPEALELIRNLHPQLNLEGVTVYKPKGCKNCGDTGVAGRVGVYEFLEIDETLRDLITNADLRGIRNNPPTSPSLYEDGLMKVLKGLISYDALLESLGLSKISMPRLIKNGEVRLREVSS